MWSPHPFRLATAFALMKGRLIIQNCSVCALALCEGPANNNCLLSFKQLVVTTTNSRAQQEMWKVKALFPGFNKICPALLVCSLSDLLCFLSTKMCLCRHSNFNLYTTSNHGDFFFFVGWGLPVLPWLALVSLWILFRVLSKANVWKV